MIQIISLTTPVMNSDAHWGKTEKTEDEKEIYTIVTQINSSIQFAKEQMVQSEEILKSSELALNRTINSFHEIELSVKEVVKQNELFVGELESMNELKTSAIENSRNILDAIQSSASSTEEISATTAEQSNQVESILDKIHTLEEKVQSISSSL